MLECGLDLNIKPSLFEAQSAPTTIRANVVEMATSIMQVFLLAPSVRAVRRRELMRKIAREELWQASARHLVEYHPSIALLEDLRSFLRVLAEATRRRNFENRTQMLTPLHELQSLREAPVPIWRLAAGILTVILMWLVAMVFIAVKSKSQPSRDKSTTMPDSGFQSQSEETRSEKSRRNWDSAPRNNQSGKNKETGQ